MLYPIGIQSFSEIREGGFVYVDKTAQIYDLASTGKYYFLSRPRRFGKSLLVSTMGAYFSGRKELFSGLAMEVLEKEWRKYPVLHLDLTGSKYTEVGDLREKLDQHLLSWEREYGVKERFEDSGARFGAVIDTAYRKTGEKVVILVDEYEKPIVDNIEDVPLETLTGTNYVGPAPVTLMYQTGYLTIRSYNPEFYTYTLDYPNEEVKRGFLNSLSQLYAPALIMGEFSVVQFVRDIRGGDVEGWAQA